MFKFFAVFILVLLCVCEIKPQTDKTTPKLERFWHYENTELNDFDYVICDEGLIVTTITGKVILIDINDGKTVWTNDLGGEFAAKPVFTDGKLSIASKIDDNSFYKREISIKTGITVKTELIKSGAISSQNMQLASDNLFDKVSVENNLLIKSKNNVVVWKNKFGGNINDISFFKNNILVSSSDNFLYSISSKSGNKVWKLRFTGKVLGSEVLSEDIGITNVFGSNQIYLVNLANGKLVSTLQMENTEYSILKPLSADKKVIIQTNLGLICFVKK
jgi:outer membrane protein assembly factor BamB